MTQRGVVGDEAARLFEAVQAWARAAGAEVGHDSACRICPLCQAIALVRDARPETVGHLADAVGSFALAVRAALDGYADGKPRPSEPRVEHIDVH